MRPNIENKRREYNLHLEAAGYAISGPMSDTSQTSSVANSPNAESFKSASTTLNNINLSIHPQSDEYENGTDVNMRIEPQKGYGSYNDKATQYNERLKQNIEDYQLIKDLDLFNKEMLNVQSKTTQKITTSSDLYADPKLTAQLDRIPEYKQRLGLDKDASDEQMYKAMQVLCNRYVVDTHALERMQNDCKQTKTEAERKMAEEYGIAEFKLDVLKNWLHDDTKLGPQVELLLKAKKTDEESLFSQAGKFSRSIFTDKPEEAEDPIHKAKMAYLKAAKAFVDDPSPSTKSGVIVARQEYDNAKSHSGLVSSLYREAKESLGIDEARVETLMLDMEKETNKFADLTQKLADNKLPKNSNPSIRLT